MDHAIKKSFAKSADERWQSAADWRDELRGIATAGSAAGAAAPVAASRKLHERLAWSLALVFALIAALANWQFVRGRRSLPTPLRLSILLPPTEALSFS